MQVNVRLLVYYVFKLNICFPYLDFNHFEKDLLFL